jgi:hypothetical protein
MDDYMFKNYLEEHGVMPTAKRLRKYKKPKQKTMPRELKIERKSDRKRRPIDTYDLRKFKKDKTPLEEREIPWMMWDTNYVDKKTKKRMSVHRTRESPVGEERVLNPDWVKWRFTKIQQREWVRKPDTWVELSPGDSSGITVPPPAEDPHVPIKYPERGLTCLASSFASVLHIAGYTSAARSLYSNIGELSQGKDELLQKFNMRVNKLNIKDDKGRILEMRTVKSYNPLLGPTPASVVLKGTDNGITHAIAISENYIVDSSWANALPRTADTLDWCCLPASYMSPQHAYVLLPRKKKKKKKKKKK